ncbi:hypothetical protein QUB61_34315 [Microcoleus sp. C2D2]
MRRDVGIRANLSSLKSYKFNLGQSFWLSIGGGVRSEVEFDRP